MKSHIHLVLCCIAVLCRQLCAVTVVSAALGSYWVPFVPAFNFLASQDSSHLSFVVIVVRAIACS